jgi:hypothetical protein
MVYLFKVGWQITLYMLAIIPITHAISYYQTQIFLIYESQSQGELAKVGSVYKGREEGKENAPLPKYWIFLVFRNYFPNNFEGNGRRKEFGDD